MSKDMMIWILAGGLLICLFALSAGTAYFLSQWKRMDHILERFQQSMEEEEAGLSCYPDVLETRESRIVSQLQRILTSARFQQDRAVGEKDQVMKLISDISHQLKTPLAALNIYNSLLQEEAKDFPAIEEYAALSERELDRMEMLIQNLLKIARLDAGSIVFEKKVENVADMMEDIQLHFSCRAKEEQKEMILAGSDEVSLFCDRVWLMEAVSNVVKNAFDHTGAGGCILIEWKAFISLVQITVKDNGCGIHPEDLYHIFKRFYRSRFSKDTQGAGLGLPLAKAIVEAHNGTIEVKSRLGAETCFTINFLTGP